MEPSAGRIDLWQDTEGSWRWAYREGSSAGEQEEPLVLPGNRSYGTREAALHAAETSFPGVPVRHAPPPEVRAARHVDAYLSMVDGAIGIVVAAGVLAAGVAAAKLVRLGMKARKLRRRFTGGPVLF
jgi:hypothetical protein